MPSPARLDPRLEKLAAELTLDEKAALMAGADLWNTVAVPRLGIAALRVTDGPNGARGSQWIGGATSACFPCGSALGATWNPALVERVASALAEEAIAKGARVLLAPTVNIQRTPIGGRDFECYAEDPVLSSRTAVAFVRGLQARGVGACVKHFICNDVEWERHRASSEPDARALREVYLPPFEATVREAGAWTVMAAYNRLDGVHCTESEPLLETILRSDWGFDGVVISDWFATQTTAASARAGMDLEMPGPPRRYGKKLADAVRAGELPESALDACVRRILLLLDRTGVLADAPRDGGAPEQSIDRPEHRALTREAAAEAITLLRNERDALPIDTKVRTLAVIGPAADRTVIQGGGSARVSPHYAVRPLDGLRARAERAGIAVTFERGCSNERGVAPLDDRLARTPDGEPGLRVECFASPDRSGAPALSLRAASAEMLWLTTPAPIPTGQPWSARVRARIVATASGEHTFSLTSAGKTRLRIDGREVVDNWSNWERGTAFFGLGSREVSGKIELQEGGAHELEVEFFHDAPIPLAGMRIGYRGPERADAMERAVAAAANADAAVVVVGLDPDWETEGRDRESFALPGRQNELVARVAAANPRTIVVVNAGSPVAMDWANDAAAIALLWYPGQESGNALADVLFGDVDAGGRLPLTIPVRMQDTPAFLDVPGENLRIAYSEGLFVGHRWYDARDIAPRFAFGHGLSYARFEYGALRVASDRVAAGADVACEIEVTNTSARAGTEVVQLYAERTSAGVRRPLRTLAAFEKIALAAGEQRVVRFTVPARAFAHWDVAQNDWKIEAGDWQLHAGRSSRDRRSAASVAIA